MCGVVKQRLEGVAGQQFRPRDREADSHRVIDRAAVRRPASLASTIPARPAPAFGAKLRRNGTSVELATENWNSKVGLDKTTTQQQCRSPHLAAPGRTADLAIYDLSRSTRYRADYGEESLPQMRWTRVRRLGFPCSVVGISSTSTAAEGARCSPA